MVIHDPAAAFSLELIEADMLCLEDMARLCAVSPEWVRARVEEELLAATWRDGACFFSSATLWRARHMAAIERQFDATPALAALVVDMSEEIRRLRERLAFYEAAAD
ncbi:MAG: MerR family transcriptional regulator [Azovibrio sp.]|nr:MerR family transcriptional regulator [Azovibrio sp.]